MSRHLRSDEEVKEAVDGRLAERPKDLLSRRICFLVVRWGERRGGLQNAVGTTVKIYVYFCSESLCIIFPVFIGMTLVF